MQNSNRSPNLEEHNSTSMHNAQMKLLGIGEGNAVCFP